MQKFSFPSVPVKNFESISTLQFHSAETRHFCRTGVQHCKCMLVIQ